MPSLLYGYFLENFLTNKNTRGCERLEEDDPNMRLQTEAKKQKTNLY